MRLPGSVRTGSTQAGPPPGEVPPTDGNEGSEKNSATTQSVNLPPYGISLAVSLMLMVLWRENIRLVGLIFVLGLAITLLLYLQSKKKPVTEPVKQKESQDSVKRGQSTTPSIPRRLNTEISVKEGGLLPVSPLGLLRFYVAKYSGRPIPSLSESDQALHDAYHAAQLKAAEAKQLRLELERCKRRIHTLANFPGCRGFLTMATGKSAGKSTAAFGIGCAVARYGRLNVLLVPSTRNLATSNVRALARLGETHLPPNRLVESILGGDFSYKRQSRHIGITWPDGLRVVNSGTHNALTESDVYTATLFLMLLLGLSPNFDIIICDLGNDGIASDSFDLVAAQLAHAVNFAYKTQDAVTIDALRMTVQGFMSATEAPDKAQVAAKLRTELGSIKFSDGSRLPDHVIDQFIKELDETGIGISTATKVAKSAFVSNAVTPQAEHGHDDLKLNEQHLDWSDQVYDIPFDPEIGSQDKNGSLKPFNFGRLQAKTQLAYMKLAIANLEALARAHGVEPPADFSKPTQLVINEN